MGGGIGGIAAGINNFYVRATFQALAHGTTQGGMAALQGGKFWSGFAAGSLSSIMSSAWQGGESFKVNEGVKTGSIVEGIGGANATNAVGTMFVGTISGGAGAELTGGNFWQGAVTGLVVSGLNHAMHRIQQRQNLRDYLLSKDIDPDGKTDFSNQGLNDFSNKAFPEMMSEAGNPILEIIESFPDGDEGRNQDWTYGQNGCKIIDGGRIIIARISFENNLHLATTVGHELSHAIDLVNGNMNAWLLRGTEEYARYKSEDTAYSWENNMMSPYYSSFNHSIATFNLRNYGGL